MWFRDVYEVKVPKVDHNRLPQFVSLSSGKQFRPLNLGKPGISAGQAGIESIARDILRRAGKASSLESMQIEPVQRRLLQAVMIVGQDGNLGDVVSISR